MQTSFRHSLILFGFSLQEKCSYFKDDEANLKFRIFSDEEYAIVKLKLKLPNQREILVCDNCAHRPIINHDFRNVYGECYPHKCDQLFERS